MLARVGRQCSRWTSPGLGSLRRLSSASDHYAVLGVQHDASTDEIKKAYYALAKKYHPDVAPNDASSARTFALAAAASETLLDREARAEYDARMAAAVKSARHSAVESALRKSNTQQFGQCESPIEFEIRTLIENGDVEVAVDSWRVSGASLALLLFLIEVCRKQKQLPKDLQGILAALHAMEPAGSHAAGAAGAAGDAPALFTERKTKAYNDLIRLANVCDDRDVVFDIIDKMEEHGIEKDMDTWEVLSSRFSFHPTSPDAYPH